MEHGEGWTKGMALDDGLKIVSWCDGDNAQLKTIIDEESILLYADEYVTGMKQSAARTGVEQAADGGRTFPNMNALHNKATVSHIQPSSLPIKRAITSIFEELKRDGLIDLPGTKIKALINFIGLLPQTIAQACTSNGICCSFKANGMIDQGALWFPDIYKLMRQ